MAERIVVTGLGVVSPLGIGVDKFHGALAAGQIGISDVSFPWRTGYQRLRAGLLKWNDLSNSYPGPKPIGRASQFAIAAAQQALSHSELDTAPKSLANLGLVVGTTLGDADELERTLSVARDQDHVDVQPSHSPPLGRMRGRLVEFFGIEGPSHLVSSTCSAGNHAIAWGAELLQTGRTDAVLAVAADTIGFVDMLGFTRLLLQAPDLCRPFDLHRKGTILSEGAGAMVLERESSARHRGTVILAEVAGWGLSCDAAGPFSSKLEDTRGMRVAFDRAIRRAGISPEEIDHVSAHGSGTRLNDLKETLFLKQALGRHAHCIPVNGIKSMLGHSQGAASMLEAIACVLTLQQDLIYPTANYLTPDPQCDLDYVPNNARSQRVNVIMSNSFGVGGNNAIVVLKRWRG